MHATRTSSHPVIAVGMVSIIVFFLTICSVAQASQLTFEFRGTVSPFVNPILNPLILPNTSISGTYTFKSTTPDQFGGSSLIGQYALSDFSLDVLGRHYTMNSSAGMVQAIRVQPGVPIAAGTTDDQYTVLLTPPTFPGQAIIGPSINKLAPESFQLNIFGRNLFTSDALPLAPPSLANIDPTRRTFNMTFQAGGFTGELTSLTLAPVPLPGAALLFGSGLVGLTGLDIRRRLRRPMKE